ncbi:MAG: alkaline phosphatase family protein [Bacteroidales bacterium]
MILNMLQDNSATLCSRFIIVFSVTVFSLCFPPSSGYAKVLTDDSPDLIVGIVVENMRYDYLSRMWDQFGDDGFRKLVSEGSSFANARYDYIVNQSSAGYATIFTGANPSAHGIIADSWYDRLKEEIQTGVFDDNVFAVGGSFANGMRSPERMLTGTFGDELRMASDFRSRVYSVSLNDAAAVLSGGFSANAAWWFDDITGMWMTSSFYIDSLPLWVREFNSGKLPDIYLDRIWEPELPFSSYFGIGKNDTPGTFRYDLRRMWRRHGDYGIIRSVPQGNTFTKDFALNLIVNEQLGKNGNTDLIIIGFSATSEIGRHYGNFSAELQDAYLKLDGDIAHLLEFLDDHSGRSNVLVFMTSDKASAYPPSYNRSARLPGGTFSPGMAVSLLRSYMDINYGQADWVSFYNAGMIYLNHKLIEDNKISLDDIQNRASRFLNQFSGVAGTVTEDVLRRNYFSGGMTARIQSGFHSGRSGDIMIYLRQGWHERSLSGDQLSLISYDQHVPLVFYGWNIESNNFKREVGVTDIAPTISLLLNIPIPPFATGKPVKELVH